jgi:hypothetical protein
MSQISNLYATRIFLEHPLALWPLDDKNYFINSLTNSAHQIVNWNIDDNTAEWETENVPFPERNSAILTKISSASVTLTKISASPIYRSNLDPSKDSICVSTWIEDYGSLVDSYEIGFIYHSEFSQTVDSEIIKSLGPNVPQQISKTSLILESFDFITPFINVRYIDESASPIEYKILFTSTSVGQWSEEYVNDFNIGILDSEIVDLDIVPVISSLPYSEEYRAFPLDAYGFQDEDNAYAIIDNNKLLAKNSKFPMLYGSDNITSIESPITEGMPSLILPGKGFLNKNGRYKNLTFEFWLKINPKLNVKRKIFGPIRSGDGLYVNNEYLEIKINDYTKSYFVGKWYRPMLINIRYSLNEVNLLINGDVVISIPIDLSQINFPDRAFDWLGFYGSDDFYSYQIDCVAIYPYIVPDQVVKRRFLYAQAIENRELVTDSFNGQSYNVDFSFANYSTAINYPDRNPWNSGIFNNMDANNKFLSFNNTVSPKLVIFGDPLIDESLDEYAWSAYSEGSDVWYDLLADQTWESTLYINDTLVTNIYNDNYKIQSGSTPFFKIRPNYGYTNINGSIEFDSINLTSDKITSIHAVFKTLDILPDTPQILMYFYNTLNNNFFKIEIIDGIIQYVYNNQVIRSNPISTNTIFCCGIDLNQLNTSYSNILNNFFSSPELISLSLMGRGDQTFLGEFYQISFNNNFFTKKDLFELFDTDGTTIQSKGVDQLTYIGSYTYKPILSSTSLYLDICKAGYWEDSIPLSYFGKQIFDNNGTTYYDVDQIQFNIDFPSSTILNNNDVLNNNYESVKIYATLQSMSETGFISYSRYKNIQPILNNRVLDFDNTIDVLETKFEIIDGTTIFPPKELVDFRDYYLTIHIEAKVEALNNKNFEIRKMMLSSIVTDENSFTKISARSGNLIYPITRYGNLYSLKDKNPFFTYTESTPSLYLTADSGITILPYEKSVGSNAERAFYIPINKNKIDKYSLGAVQFWGMYNYSNIIDKERKIAKIFTPDKKYEIVLEPIDNGKRGIIKTYDLDTGLISDFRNESIKNVVYYQDGSLIKNPIINPLKWTSITLSFGDNIQVDSVSGNIEFYEGFIYTNIATYEKFQLFTNFIVGSRNWQEVRVGEILTETGVQILDNSWESWNSNTWQDIYSPVEAFRFAIDGSSIFKSYVGTSGIVSNDRSSIVFEENGLDIFSGIVWDTRLVKPV